MSAPIVGVSDHTTTDCDGPSSRSLRLEVQRQRTMTNDSFLAIAAATLEPPLWRHSVDTIAGATLALGHRPSSSCQAIFRWVTLTARYHRFAAERSCRVTTRWITLTAALHRLELDRSRTFERHRAHNEQLRCGCGGGFGMGYCAIASHHPPAAAASSARLGSDASGENPTACKEC